jgi:hypothetical protein
VERDKHGGLLLLSTQKQLYGRQSLLSVRIIQEGRRKKGMQQREFALYKRRLLSLIPGKLQDIPNRDVKIKFFRSSLIEQVEKEKDWQFTGEQAAELIRMTIYPDLRSEEERMQYDDFLMNGLDRVMSENEE